MGLEIDAMLDKLDLDAASNDRRVTSKELDWFLSRWMESGAEWHEVTAQEVLTSRIHRSATFDWAWVGTTLALMGVILAAPQVLADVTIPVLAIMAVFCGGAFLSYKVRQAVQQRRSETVREDVLAEAAALKLDAERRSVRARLLELESAGVSAESEALKREAGRLTTEASVLERVADLIEIRSPR